MEILHMYEKYPKILKYQFKYMNVSMWIFPFWRRVQKLHIYINASQVYAMNLSFTSDWQWYYNIICSICIALSI